MRASSTEIVPSTASARPEPTSASPASVSIDSEPLRLARCRPDARRSTIGPSTTGSEIDSIASDPATAGGATPASPSRATRPPAPRTSREIGKRPLGPTEFADALTAMSVGAASALCTISFPFSTSAFATDHVHASDFDDGADAAPFGAAGGAVPA